MSLISIVPSSMWLRLLMLVYRAKWKLRPLARMIGLDLRMSWSEVIFATKILLPQIASYDPDIVIGVGIGGAIWGGVLAGSLHDKPLMVVDRRVYHENQQRKVELIAGTAVSTSVRMLTGKSILVVCAEIISAQTTVVVLKELEAVQPRDIKVACLDYHPNAQRSPDYWYCRNSASAIQKPWRAVPTYTCIDEPVRP